MLSTVKRCKLRIGLIIRLPTAELVAIILLMSYLNELLRLLASLSTIFILIICSRQTIGVAIILEQGRPTMHKMLGAIYTSQLLTDYLTTNTRSSTSISITNIK